MKRTGLCLLMVAACAFAGWAMGQAERAAATTGRAEYLAERGTIIPREEIRIDSLIAAVDFGYPEPKDAFGISVYTGHKQVAAPGQSELVLVGLQGKRRAFADLPPLNLVLVVDSSGSMGEPDELEWVKESLAILLKTLREKDYLALVVFNTQARLLTPSTRMSEPGIRERLLQRVQALRPEGESNIVEGLALGLQQALTHFDPGQTNRLMLLSDGWGDARGVDRLVREYRAKGVEVSVVGYGAHFDTRFADQLAAAGGGSSRFISDRNRMAEVFGSGLARATVALARDIELRLRLEYGLVSYTWGYENQVAANRRSVRYHLPVIHNGDYETILLEIYLPASKRQGIKPVVVVEGRWKDLDGTSHELDPVEAQLDFVQANNPVAGFSDARVLKAGSILHYALSLQQISNDYYQAPFLGETFFRDYGMLKELKNTRLRLSDPSFDEPIDVLTKYGLILGVQIGLRKTIVEQILADDELRATEADRPLTTRLDYLFRELLLRLKDVPPGAIAVSGFRQSGREGSALVDLINQAGASRLNDLAAPGFSVVERDRLDAVLREQELALSDLVEPAKAVRVGRILAARYLVTGSVIPTADSVVVFARIINVQTAVIESAAQVIIPRSTEVDSLL
jgi:hypothetical protein